MRQTRQMFAISALAVLGSACTSGLLDSKQPASQTFVLAAAQAQHPSQEMLPIDLIVARPTTRPGLDTERIAVLFADRRLDYYAASRWGASADIVVQNLLVESLRNSGRLRTAQSDLSAFSANYLLQTELRDFQAEYRGGGVPTVRVTLQCTLGQMRGRQPLASYSATASAPASDDHLRAVVAAFEAAYQEAARSVVNDTLAALTAAVTHQSTEEAAHR